MSPVHDPDDAAAPGAPAPTAGFAPPGSASAPVGRRSPYGARADARRTSVLGAHQPGPVPLRPLRAGDLMDGALAILRGNPAPLILPSLALGLLALLGPLAVGAVLDLVPGAGGGLGDAPADGLRRLWSSGLVLTLRAGMSVLGAVLLVGIVAQVVVAAAVGERIDLGEAWRRTRGRRGALVLLAVLVTAAVTAPVVGWLLLLGAAAGVGPGAVVVVLVLGLSALVLSLAWPGVRLLYLCVPAHAVERIGARRSMARSWALSRGRYWHLVGTALMALGVCLVATILLALPLSLLGSFAPTVAGVPGEVVGLGLDAVAQVLAQALAVPFAAVVCSLQYLDLRIRAEAYDVELLARADASSAALAGRGEGAR